MPVPAKSKVFAWRLAKNSIPTEVVRHRRNMADSALCPICHAAEDNWRHALIDCTMAKCVWALLDEELTEHVIQNSFTDAKPWLFLLMESMPAAEFAIILTTLWAVWWARRKAIHEEKIPKPLVYFCFYSAFPGGLLEQKRLAGRARGIHRWIPPPPGLIKINVDAGISRSGAGGAIVAVCRDEAGLFLGASAVTVPGLTDPTVLEAMAYDEAVSLAADLNLTKVCVASGYQEPSDRGPVLLRCDYQGHWDKKGTFSGGGVCS
ncbi:hypothetical protein BRADI_2g36635v3 [Brachypodium distachyon]|uniref:Reverse transcriptase zinc-binding domain-containing protein n=1 Tax=Brachypodium distachyon TaxID=15368 RepID=A0A2K2DC70_BRADI|nr:hypothetical protein BRADI_2g36635v3 [Brachypodium distachyon]